MFFVFPQLRMAWPGLVWCPCLRNQAAVLVGGAKKIVREELIARIFLFFSLYIHIYICASLFLEFMIEYNKGCP